MVNYMYGILTSATVISMLNIINEAVPNDLWYWATLYLPF